MPAEHQGLCTTPATPGSVCGLIGGQVLWSWALDKAGEGRPGVGKGLSWAHRCLGGQIAGRKGTPTSMCHWLGLTPFLLPAGDASSLLLV